MDQLEKPSKFTIAALIDRHGEPDWSLRGLGHLTSGTYFFVSSLEMIAKRAQRIADDLLSTLPDSVKPTAAIASPT